MGLRIVSLISGSKGNATLILSDKTALLVDAGISHKQLSTDLKTFGLRVEDLDGVLITHEHNDHIKYLSALVGICKIYAHYLTVEAICKRPDMEISYFEDVDNFEEGFTIGDINVYPFRVMHDCAFPVGYTFECEGKRASILTDTGDVNKNIYDAVKYSSVIVLESNYDKNMLVTGKYPYMLKKRILSDNGHLSNVRSSGFVRRLAQDGIIKKVALAHLSENNNTREIAYNEMKEQTKDFNIDLYMTYQDKMSEVIEVE